MTGKDSLFSGDEDFYSEKNISRDYKFTEEDISVIKEVQEDLSLVPRPFGEIGRRLNMSSEDVTNCLKRFNKAGIMRRVAAILHHRKAGFRANAMGVWKVPEDMIEQIALRMASSLFTMIHGRSAKDCNSLIKKLSELTGINEYDTLYSSKEYKKTRLKYFSNDYKIWEQEYSEGNLNAVSIDN